MPDLRYKTRRRLSVVLLLIWLPLYVILVSAILARLPRLPIYIEVVIYVLAAFLWAVPFRFVFKGVGKADPDQPAKRFKDDDFLDHEKANRNKF